MVASITERVPLPRVNMANLTRRLSLVTALCALYPFAAAGTALADDLAPGQAVATGQQAIANGVATQTAPTNMVVSVRINSPGVNGPISQSNVTVVTVGATNGSATSQGGGTGPASGAQQAATGQDAGATGEGTQSQPSNIVISIRINSPGNDGPVSQTNLVAVGVSAGNASSTDQTTGSAGGREAPRTASPVTHVLRHGAAPAEAADHTTAAHSRRAAPRRSAPAPGSAGKPAPKSLERPFSGAAAAHTAGVQAAAARALTRHIASASSFRQAAASVQRHVEQRAPSMSPRGAQQGWAGPLTLTAIALLGGLLVWLSSTWLGGRRSPLRTAWGNRS
jgi:hypothetical protein